MFTGIIEGLGTVVQVRPAGDGCRIGIAADFVLDGTRIGDSIAVNGACLTAVSLDGRRFDADVSPETVAKTTFGNVRVGERVNLERALRLADRIDGHLVSGHIDGLGRLTGRSPQANALIVTVEVPESLARYMIPKGSVAVDGTSLTINQCDRHSFQVSIIPHTAKLTTIGFKPIGGSVNIETDMLGKYVERFIALGRSGGNTEQKKDGVDLGLLHRSGFI
ncbi:MAG: riboflavin synthase [Desulfobacterales bacterium]|nr:riboflavin synthase [Desulfobacterales bacterium]